MKNFLISLTLLTFSSIIYAQDVVFHHQLTVKINPATSLLEVTDTITIPESEDSTGLTFSLHENL